MTQNSERSPADWFWAAMDCYAVEHQGCPCCRSGTASFARSGASGSSNHRWKLASSRSAWTRSRALATSPPATGEGRGRRAGRGRLNQRPLEESQPPPEKFRRFPCSHHTQGAERLLDINSPVPVELFPLPSDCGAPTSSVELSLELGSWLDLMSRSSSDEPTLSPQWSPAWWRVFGPRQGGSGVVAIELAGLRQRTRPPAGRAAPLLLRRVWHRGMLPLRRLEVLASGEPEQDATCSAT